MVYDMSTSIVSNTMYTHSKKLGFIAVVLGLLFPSVVSAAGFEIAGWIPYWRSEKGVASILPQLDLFTEVNPFFYTVSTNGELFSNGSLSDAEWVSLRNAAKANGILFIPTVMWANADAMDEIFRDPALRQKHIKSIAWEVYSKNLDGIDIDYEARYARTRTYFSQFLKELEEAIGFDKHIMCTMQSRTPLDSRYETLDAIPADIEYANDFVEINKYCDRVRIMAYDQARIDVKLNKEKGDPYAPTADVDWVEKVMRVAAQEVDADKLIIGVPTYGYEYDMFEALDGSGEIQYSRLWSLNPGYGIETAQTLGLTPTRNSAGELQILYPAKDAPDPVIPLDFATRVLTWSDAQAIQDKIELAEELGLRGIAIFKIDGGQDPALWSVLTGKKGESVATVNLKDSTLLTESPNKARAVPQRDLEYGDRNEDVRALQLFLNQEGYIVALSGGGSPGNETTFFGPATKAALVRFQKAHGVSPTSGYYGPITRTAISSL